MTRCTLFFVLANLVATSACDIGDNAEPDEWGNGQGEGPDAGSEPDIGTEPGDGIDAGSGTDIDGETSDDLPPALRTVTVETVSQLKSALSNAKPGDLIRLRNKTWQFTSAVDIPRSGTAENPIVIAAETVGGVTITGSAGFDLSSVSYVVIRGFNFRYTAGRIGLDCDDCGYVRITRNRFELAGTVYSHWVRLTGESHHNRIDRNVFINKRTMGNMVNIDGTSSEVAYRNVIELNHFSNHSYADYNNGECIRVGFSGLKYSKGYNVIRRNLFERCNGDPEVISNKASNTTIQWNTFRDNNGALVFRHGHGSQAIGNFFFGNNGGIRVYGDDHRIMNNYFEGNRGTGARSTIVIGGGNALDDSATSTGNDASERVLVAFNTLVNNSAHIAIGASSSEKYGARDCTIANNLIVGNSGSFARELRAYSGFRWAGNLLSGSASTGEFPSSGYTRTSDPKLVSSGGVRHIASNSPARDKAAGSYSSIVTDDMDGQKRAGTYDIGADEYSTAATTRSPLGASNVGTAAN